MNTSFYLQGQIYKRQLDKLKRDVNIMLVGKEGKPLHQFELIGLLQRLGVSYHFEWKKYLVQYYLNR